MMSVTNQGLEKMSIAPILKLRLGSQNHLYMSGHVGDDINFGFYRYFAKAGIGGAIPMANDYFRYHLGINERGGFLIDTICQD